MRIGIVETGLPPHWIGGAELQAWQLARNLARDNTVTIFTRRPGGSAARETVSGVRICRIQPFPRPLGIASYLLGMLVQIGRRRRRLDVLLCFRTWPNGFAGWLVHRATGLPFCVSIRGGDWYFVQPKCWGHLVLDRLLTPDNHVVVQTPRIGDEVREFYPQVNPVVIPNGIDPSPGCADGPHLLFVGNLLARKGVDVLIEALRALPEVSTLILGDGPERTRLEHKAARMKNIRFLGAVAPSAVRDLMITRGRLLVLPAVAGEGLPNVLLEAMSVGLPVIASDIAGTNDLLEGGAAGLLVPPGDAAALRTAVDRLWHDDALRSNLAEAGWRVTARHDWKSVTAQWEALFRKVVAKG